MWSLLKIHAWDRVRRSSGIYGGYHLSDSGNQDIRELCRRLWFNYFKQPLDLLGDNWTEVLAQLRKQFFACAWFEAYEFVEFVENNYARHEFRDHFTSACNDILEREVSAYRFVDGLIARITESEQLDEVELALASASGPVRTHLRRALELLADREVPDYRNSIKEAVSAVESLVATTVDVEHGTLGQLLKRLEDDIGLHPALRTAFSNLYGYTSDEGGIRHALLESETSTFEDAKFFLVVCSAFVNFVESKVKRANMACSRRR